MKDIHNNPLFTEITAEEELTVQGGNPALLIAAVKWGRPAVQIAIRAARWWLSQPGNGVIFWDRKRTKDWEVRAGAGITNDTDVPGSAGFGIKTNGRWQTFS
ncbi:MAG TPA: hypothetical protein V6D21_05835 [Candidatus Obscuribacterales bacterium]